MNPFQLNNQNRPQNMPTGKRKQWGEIKPPTIPAKPDYIGSNFLDLSSP